MIHLTLKVLVPDAILLRSKGRELLELIVEFFPGHIPERFGSAEPLIASFNVNEIDKILESWGRREFMALRINPRFKLHVHFWPLLSRDPRHSFISIDLELVESCDKSRLGDFVYGASEMFSADYSVAHILTRSELENRLEIINERPAVWPQASGRQTVERLRHRIAREGFASVLWSMDMPDINTVRLRKCLPGLYWLNVFGRPYLEMFGREKILETPAYETRELSNGAIGLKITEHLDDSSIAFDKFSAIREICKSTLNESAFFQPAFSAGHNYTVPEFHFPKKMYKERFQGPSQVH